LNILINKIGILSPRVGIEPKIDLVAWHVLAKVRTASAALMRSIPLPVRDEVRPLGFDYLGVPRSEHLQGVCVQAEVENNKI
jgi:hypothetical protein